MSMRRLDRAVADYVAMRDQLIAATDEFVALVVGTLGTLVGSAITGLDPVWNGSVDEFLSITLGLSLIHISEPTRPY